jgi:hypothetical protein
MANTTLKELARRLDQLEQEVVRLRQGLGLAGVAEGNASRPVDLDAALDRLFESAGIQGEFSGLAQLRVLQAEQEQVWAQRRRNGPSPGASSPRRKKKPGSGG